ncbi:MAG: methyltransferase domain-containing protein [Thermomicrobiales bacterium]
MRTSPTDSEAFHAFEHGGWERIVTAYDAAFQSLTAQTIDPLLDAAGVGPGTQLLDEATGPGYVAAAAVARGADVVAIDFAVAMVAEAQCRHPDLDVREADVEALPFADSTFDAVVMNFGALHLAQPDLAFAEAFRILRPGGRFAFTVWSPPEVSTGFAMVLQAIQSHGTIEVPLPPGPPLFRFGDPAESTRTLAAVGFTATTAVVLSLVWQLPGPAAMLEVMQRATVRTAGLLQAQSAPALAAIREAVTAEAATYTVPDGIAVPMGATLTAGRKPRP